MLRRIFNLIVIISFLLLACSASLWVGQYHRVASRSENRIVEAQLDRLVPEVMFEGVGLSDTLDFLRDISGAVLEVNWLAIEAAGVNRNTPISLKVVNVKFSKVIAEIVSQAGLAFAVDGSTIRISTRNDLSRVCDVHREEWPWSSDADRAEASGLANVATIYSEKDQVGFRPLLEDVLADVFAQTGVRIDPQWDELKAVGIDP